MLSSNSDLYSLDVISTPPPTVTTKNCVQTLSNDNLAKTGPYPNSFSSFTPSLVRLLFNIYSWCEILFDV